MEYVYHFKPNNFSGKYLLPLSQLRKRKPKHFQEEISKYHGREKWITREIPGLDCAALDVVNFSCLNPANLLAVLKIFKIEEVEPKIIWQIPVKSIKEDAVVFSYGKELDYAYEEFNKKTYKELKTIPMDTIEYYLECRENGQSPLLFEYVPHVLVRGKVDISEAKVFEFK